MQMITSALRSVLAPFRLPARTWGWVLLYLALAAVILGGVGAGLVAYQGQLRAAALAHVFPASWIPAAELVLDRFFSLQARTVLINGVLGLSLMVVTIALFWSKELLSASYEKRAGLLAEPMRELTLREQAWQEVKLFALFTAAQAVIFWIGYGPEGARQSVASVLRTRCSSPPTPSTSRPR